MRILSPSPLTLKVFGAAAILAFTAPMPAQAQTLLKTFKDWRAFKTTQGGKTLCYIASTPKKKQGNYNRRSDALLFVTSVPGAQDEVSVTSGYPYAKNKDVALNIAGAGSFKLFVQNEMAWAYSTTDDKKMIAGMIAKSTLTVKGTSKIGTYSLDTYSLSGFSSAYSHIRSNCR